MILDHTLAVTKEDVTAFSKISTRDKASITRDKASIEANLITQRYSLDTTNKK